MKRYLIILFLVLSFPSFGESEDKQFEKLVYKSASKFAHEYNKSYLCKAVATKEIKSGASYQCFLAMSGLWASSSFNQKGDVIYFENPNHMGAFMPVDVLVSDLILPDSNEVCHIRQSPYSSPDSFCIDRIYNEYRIDMDYLLLLRKRAIEIFGPLNAKNVSDYSYSYYGKNRFGGPTIEFSSNKPISTFMRIHCPSGMIFLDDQNRIRKVSVRNMEDRYSDLMRYDDPEEMVSVADYSFSVEYEWLKDGVVTSYVEQNIKWKQPEDLTLDRYFRPEVSPFKDPFKNRAVTIQKVYFSQFKSMDSMGKGWDDDLLMLHYIPDSRYSYWERELKDKVPFKQIESEMSRCGMSLKEQNDKFIANWLERIRQDLSEYAEMPDEQIELSMEKIKWKGKVGRSTFENIYSKKYYE